MADKIFPFLWHHGETKEAILKEIEKIHECGIRAFCVESRPHPDFCGEQWWEDMGFILQEARKRDMRVWLLDEQHYPSGSANGEILRREDLQQTNVLLTYMDVCGPLDNGKILLTYCRKEEELVAAFAFPARDREFVFQGGVDLTDRVHDNVLYWDIPVGHYRVFAVYKTKQAAAWNFVDVLNPKSTALMIEQIYEPHYRHFSEYFGNTFVGFFSDEPRFGNGAYYEPLVKRHWKDRGLGVLGMSYPWCDEMLHVLGLEDKRLLVSLWYNLDVPECAEFRVRYMDYISGKFAENFSGMLGKWCEEHGVMYSGHIIEDEGAHARTCCSAGHYFRSTEGQDIAGVDVVYNQIDTDFIDDTHAISGCPNLVNDRMYNFTLAKLASSAAHLDKKKQGKALCEIFGAFGWGENIAKMKMLVDFMIVRGINHFIPHAFNPFIEDEDSPPYFYCGGLNPQYDSFKTLSEYMLKMSEIFEGGKTDIRVAVLYHADAEWSGLPCLSVDSVCKYLMQRQIDFDIVPEYEIKEIGADYIRTENCTYRYLVIPYRTYFKKSLKNMLDANPNVWTMAEDLCELDKVNWGAIAPYALAKPCKHIRVYKYTKEDVTYYFVVNESKEICENELWTGQTGYYSCKDMQSGFSESGKTEGCLSFRLSAGQSLLFAISQKPVAQEKYQFLYEEKTQPLWQVYISDAPFEKWNFYDETFDLYDLAAWDRFPSFCGKIRYCGKFTLKELPQTGCLLDLGTSNCGIRVRLNSVDLGERIASPYAFEASGVIKEGENDLDIVVTTTLGLLKRDCYTHFMAIGKYGLPQNPVVRFYTK